MRYKKVSTKPVILNLLLQIFVCAVMILVSTDTGASLPNGRNASPVKRGGA
jgi:hypothetical protein